MDKYLQRAYALQSPAEAQELYNEWAADYDAQLSEIGYATPRRCVEALMKHLKHENTNMIKILDAGCGTGLVGRYLASSSLSGHFVLDGVDISPGMLEVASKEAVYHDLSIANLNDTIAKHNSTYDVIICCGTLTKGHVGPKALSEFARLVRRSGLVIATVHDDIWEVGGFKAEAERLQGDGITAIVSTDQAGILDQDVSGVRMLILKRS